MQVELEDDRNNPDLAPVPTEWKLPDRLAKDVVYENIENGLRINEDDRQYQLRKWVMFFCCLTSSMVGTLFVLMGLSLTVFFEASRPNLTYVYVAGVFFLPFVVWFCYLCFPFRSAIEYRNRIHDKRMRMNVINQRKKAYHQGRNCDLKLDDEYVYVENNEDKITEKFFKNTFTRGEFYNDQFKYNRDNPQTNDYYHKYVWYGEWKRYLTMKDRNRYVVPDPEAFSIEDHIRDLRTDPNDVGKFEKAANLSHEEAMEIRKKYKFEKRQQDKRRNHQTTKNQSKFKIIATQGTYDVKPIFR